MRFWFKWTKESEMRSRLLTLMLLQGGVAWRTASRRRRIMIKGSFATFRRDLAYCFFTVAYFTVIVHQAHSWRYLNIFSVFFFIFCSSCIPWLFVGLFCSAPTSFRTSSSRMGSPLTPKLLGHARLSCARSHISALRCLRTPAAPQNRLGANYPCLLARS